MKIFKWFDLPAKKRIFEGIFSCFGLNTRYLLNKDCGTRNQYQKDK